MSEQQLRSLIAPSDKDKRRASLSPTERSHLDAHGYVGPWSAFRMGNIKWKMLGDNQYSLITVQDASMPKNEGTIWTAHGATRDNLSDLLKKIGTDRSGLYTDDFADITWGPGKKVAIYYYPTEATSPYVDEWEDFDPEWDPDEEVLSNPSRGVRWYD